MMAELALLSAAAGAIGTGISAMGSIAQGNAAKSMSNFKARQEEMQAQESRAAAQRTSLERRREGELVQSRLQARAAASGGAADDPGTIKLGEDIAARSEYMALTDQYVGENRARGLEDQAMGTRMTGSSLQRGSNLAAAGTLLSGAGSMFDKFGRKSPPNGNVGF